MQAYKLMRDGEREAINLFIPPGEAPNLIQILNKVKQKKRV